MVILAIPEEQRSINCHMTLLVFAILELWLSCPYTWLKHGKFLPFIFAVFISKVQFQPFIVF